MKTIIISFVIIISCASSQAKDIQLFNPDLFGQPTSNAVKLLYDKKSDESEPSNITTDIRCGKYYAASVFYASYVTFSDARESLNKLYKNHENLKLLQENKIAVWRVENKGFSIQLTREEDQTRINYINYKVISADKECFNRD
jgi:hypothetical protein